MPINFSFGKQKPASANKSAQKPNLQKPLAATAGQKRQLSAVLGPGEHDSEGDEEEGKPQVTQELSSFAGAQASQRDAGKERVIKPLPNRDWRGESQNKQQESSKADDEEDRPVQYGLTVTAKTNEENAGGDVSTPKSHERPEKSRRSQREGLINKREQASYASAYKTAPEQASMAEYEAMPVEGFGASLLRGYLKEGQTLDDIRESQKGNDRSAQIKKRAGLLGIGAKDISKSEGLEIGAWGQKSRNSNKGPNLYTPLARRNKATGEIMPDEPQKSANGKDQDSREGGRDDKRLESSRRRERSIDRSDKRSRR